jgi:hypothetical protein
LLLIPAALVVVIGVVFGLAGSGLLTGVRPVGSDMVISLEWTTHPFVPGARVVALTTVGDRLIATGSLEDKPAAWYSDDGGATWTAAEVEPPPSTLGRSAAGAHALGYIAEHGGQLAAIDAYTLGIVEDVPGDTSVHTTVWLSTDQGMTWRATEGIPAAAGRLTKSPNGFAAFPIGISGENVGWFSEDGRSWKSEQTSGIRPMSSISDVAFNGSVFVMIGTQKESDSQTDAKATAWRSEDGLTWAPTTLPASLGTAMSVTASDDRFLVGGAAYAGQNPQDARAVVWSSRDGKAWRRTDLPSDSNGPTSATETVSGRLGSLVRISHFYQRPAISDEIWLISSEEELIGKQDLERQVAAMAALPDRFVLVTQCATANECDSPTVSIGTPVYGSESTATAAATLPAATEIPIAGVRESITRQNLADARNGIPGDLLEPGWLPGGFALVNAEYSAEGDEINSVDLRYEGGGHYVHVWQTRTPPEQLGQKDPVAKGSPLAGTQWTANPLPSGQVGVEYSRRLEDGRTVSIDSDLDESTMRHVLDSMYLHPSSASAS